MPMRAPILIEHEGRTTTLKALAKASGLNYWTLYTRYSVGKTGDDLTRAVTSPRPKGSDKHDALRTPEAP